jgi:hypothetical protein
MMVFSIFSSQPLGDKDMPEHSHLSPIIPVSSAHCFRTTTKTIKTAVAPSGRADRIKEFSVRHVKGSTHGLPGGPESRDVLDMAKVVYHTSLTMISFLSRRCHLRAWR